MLPLCSTAIDAYPPFVVAFTWSKFCDAEKLLDRYSAPPSRRDHQRSAVGDGSIARASATSEPLRDLPRWTRSRRRWRRPAVRRSTGRCSVRPRRISRRRLLTNPHRMPGQTGHLHRSRETEVPHFVLILTDLSVFTFVAATFRVGVEMHALKGSSPPAIWLLRPG